jgi:Tol biopolymer transport system component
VEVATGQVTNITQNIGNPTRRIYHHPHWGPTNEIIFSKNDTLYWITPTGGFLRKQGYPGWASQPKWSPSGGQIVFTYIDVSVLPSRVNLALIDADGTHLSFLTDEAFINADPEWSPAGEEIAFRSHREGDGDIFVMRTNGPRTMRNLTRRPDRDAGPSWR